MPRSPSPEGAAGREPSWLNFRAAAQLRKEANRTRRRVIGALTLAHAALWAPIGALPALLSCALLGSRGHVGFDEICVMGACHQLGAFVAAVCFYKGFGSSARTSCERALILAALSVAGTGLMPFTTRSRRIVWVGVARLLGGYAMRAASDAIPALVDEGRLVRFERVASSVESPSSSCSYVGQMEDIATQTTSTTFGSRALALRGAPFLGSASGFSLGFCLTLPLVARATLDRGGKTFLPRRLAKVFAWYASLRQTTHQVPVNRDPPTCHQRALAARDAWRWAHFILSAALLIATIRLHIAFTKKETVASAAGTTTTAARRPTITTSTIDVEDSSSSSSGGKRRKSMPEKKLLGSCSPPPISSHSRGVEVPRRIPQREPVDARLLSCAALCVDASLVVAQFVGATVLQIALRLPPRDAAIAVVVAYAGVVPAAGGLLGALALRLSLSRTVAPAARRAAARKARQQRPRNLVLLRKDRAPSAVAREPTTNDDVVTAVRRQSTSSLSMIESPAASDDVVVVPWSSSSSATSRPTPPPVPKRHSARKLLHPLTPNAQQQPMLDPHNRSEKALSRRRAACVLALVCTIVATCLISVVTALWLSGENIVKGPMNASEVNRRDLGVRLALGAFGSVCAALPSFAVLLTPQLLALPTTSLFRAAPFVIAGLADRHLNRSRLEEDIFPENFRNSNACREFAAPPEFRLAARVFVSVNALVLLALASCLLLASAICTRAKRRPNLSSMRQASLTEEVPLTALADIGPSPDNKDVDAAHQHDFLMPSLIHEDNAALQQHPRGNRNTTLAFFGPKSFTSPRRGLLASTSSPSSSRSSATFLFGGMRAARDVTRSRSGSSNDPASAALRPRPSPTHSGQSTEHQPVHNYYASFPVHKQEDP